MRLPLRGLLPLLGLTGLVATSTLASSASAEPLGFRLSRFEPSERGSRWFVLDSLALEGRGRVALGVVGDYSLDSLEARALRGPAGGPLTEERVRVVKNAVASHLGASVVFWDRARFGVQLPVALYADGSEVRDGQGAALLRGGRGGVVGDLRFGADVRVWGAAASRPRVALGAALYLPTGDREAYQSHGSTGLGLHAQLAGERGAYAYAARLGTLFQPQRRVGDEGSSTVGGPELRGGLSLGRKMVDGRLLLGPEVWASTSLSEDVLGEGHSSLDALLGAHYAMPSGWSWGLGAGRGFTAAFGEASLRALASLEWVGQAPGSSPSAPTSSSTPGSTWAAAPDVLSAPGPATRGAAPLSPRQALGEGQVFLPSEPDADRDGVPDARDVCPGEPGLASALALENGCPDRDKDQDGVPSGQDACPDQPGPSSSDPARRGCPQESEVAPVGLERLEPVYFRPGNHRLLPKDAPVLQKVLELSKVLAPTQRVLVEGHCDGRGSYQENQVLSERRARAVIAWLSAHGADPNRFVALGFGETFRASEDHSNEAHRLNRRVEFKVIDLGPPPAAPGAP